MEDKLKWYKEGEEITELKELVEEGTEEDIELTVQNVSASDLIGLRFSCDDGRLEVLQAPSELDPDERSSVRIRVSVNMTDSSFDGEVQVEGKFLK